jgi:hypothetical protein
MLVLILLLLLLLVWQIRGLGDQPPSQQNSQNAHGQAKA